MPTVCPGMRQTQLRRAQRYLAPLVDETRISPLGNLLGIRRCEDPDAKTVLLDAHLDQVGLIVTGRKDGMLTFTGGVGGVDDRMLPGHTVAVLTEPVRYGVIAWNRETPEDKPVPRTEMLVDCGLTKAEAEKIPVGTRLAMQQSLGVEKTPFLENLWMIGAAFLPCSVHWSWLRTRS